jgi:hypothetical protein
MGFFRLAIAVLALIFGSLGMLTGGVVTWSALKEGEITTYSTPTGGPLVKATVARARDPDGFWRQLGLLGAMPLAAGALVAVGAWRALRS